MNYLESKIISTKCEYLRLTEAMSLIDFLGELKDGGLIKYESRVFQDSKKPSTTSNSFYSIGSTFNTSNGGTWDNYYSSKTVRIKTEYCYDIYAKNNLGDFLLWNPGIKVNSFRQSKDYLHISFLGLKSISLLLADHNKTWFVVRGNKVSEEEHDV